MTPEQLRERLTQVNGDRMALAEDLFGVADFLRTHSSVQRALTDPARSQSDKDSLIDRLFGPVVGEVSLQCLHDLGQGHWSRPRDIVLKIEDAGCDAVLLNAQLDGVLEETEAQLVAIAVFLQYYAKIRRIVLKRFSRRNWEAQSLQPPLCVRICSAASSSEWARSASTHHWPRGSVL